MPSDSPRPPLPITPVLAPLREAVSSARPVVLKAPPGAGKTTSVPLAVLDIEGVREGQVWVIQPRRLAARSVAEFLARQAGEPIGQSIGYHVRLDRKESDATRVVLMTGGMFLRRMQSDPLLERCACVILDEFHERSLELDLCLALTHRLATQLRPELRLIVMSATLDPEPICEFLGPRSLALSCQGRSYPVEVTYHETVTRETMVNSVASVTAQVARRTAGHVLVFLPGVAEIDRVRVALADRAGELADSIVPLHGSLSPRQQDAAVGVDSTTTQKIILSTNIAETSVTVEGVTAVIDSGLAKIPLLDTHLGLTRLQTVPISLASADQRAGRAGRTAPGVCHRMWSSASQRTRGAYEPPEIERGDLAASLLTLASLGETDISEFPWLTPPPAHVVEAATELLFALGAIDPSHRMTELGRTLLALPLHPRIARFAIAAVEQLEPAHTALIAALLSERTTFDNVPSGFSESSIAEQAQWIQRHPKSMGRTLQRVTSQIQRSLQKLSQHGRAEKEDKFLSRTSGDQAVIARSLLAAYPDRVVLRRPGDPDRGVMVGRRGVVGLSKLAHLDSSAELLLGYDTSGSGPESRVRAAVEIDASWLSPTLIQSSVEVDFDANREAVSCRAVRRYMDLVLTETPVSCEPNDTTAERLHEQAMRHRERVLPPAPAGHESEFDTCLHRIGLIWKHCGADQQSPLDGLDGIFSEVCRELCQTRRSFAELRRAAWQEHLIGRIGYPMWQKVQSEAPTHLTLPSGNRVRVHYSADRPPWIEARIQECFGWSHTPRILEGKVAVQMHLLGPNRRPQQITEDLQSFWNHTYGEIRKELRRRYPKHHWPEDPKSAQASVNGLKPRR